jgi:Aldo/keto reductase family
VVVDIAQADGATPAQIALAWLLALAPNVLLIPGTSKRSRPAENLQAGTVALRQRKYAVSPLALRLLKVVVLILNLLVLVGFGGLPGLDVIRLAESDRPSQYIR